MLQPFSMITVVIIDPLLQACLLIMSRSHHPLFLILFTRCFTAHVLCALQYRRTSISLCNNRGALCSSCKYSNRGSGRYYYKNISIKAKICIFRYQHDMLSVEFVVISNDSHFA